MKRIFIIVLIVTIPILLLLITRFLVAKSKSEEAVGSEKYSVILAGFGSVNLLGQASGEIAPFFNVLQNPRNIKDTLSLCEESYMGKIYENDVIIVATGMGKVASSSCTTQLLGTYGNQLKEVIFSGISGISRMKVDGKETKIGDVCINYLAYDYDLQYYTADASGTNEARPIRWDLDSEFRSRFTLGSEVLAEELIKSSTGIRVWGKDRCMEASSDSFWHDVRSDRRAREIASYYLKINPDDIVVFTSMESIAAGWVVEQWNKKEKTNIAFAYVRSASNFDMPVLDFNAIPQKNGKESLEDRKATDTDFAIIQASKPVIDMFKRRQYVE